ncbi:uncharacterized protein LOC144626814 [Crassostrea virginica]
MYPAKEENEEDHPADHTLIDNSNHSKLNLANGTSMINQPTDILITGIPRNHSGIPTRLHVTIKTTETNPSGSPILLKDNINTKINPSGSLSVIEIGFDNTSTNSSTTNHLDPNQGSNIQQTVLPATMVHRLPVLFKRVLINTFSWSAL